MQLVLQYRDFKRATERLAGIPELLSKLRQVNLTQTLGSRLADCHHSHRLICCVSQARDFYVEMKWEFTSWGKYVLNQHMTLLSTDDYTDTLHTHTMTLCLSLGIGLLTLTISAPQLWTAPLMLALERFLVFLPLSLAVPLVSKVCPSDVYRVWKSGSCLRVDTTLLGFEHMTWLKGRRSYIFKGGGK